MSDVGEKGRRILAVLADGTGWSRRALYAEAGAGADVRSGWGTVISRLVKAGLVTSEYVTIQGGAVEERVRITETGRKALEPNHDDTAQSIKAVPGSGSGPDDPV